MTSRYPRKARVLDIDPDGKNAEIEFVEQHGELVIAGYVLMGPSEATAAEQAGAEIDPTPGRHLPPPEGPETIPLPHRNPRNARVLRSLLLCDLRELERLVLVTAIFRVNPCKIVGR